LLELLDSDRFADVAPATVSPRCSMKAAITARSVMYRLLAAQHQTGERRRQRIHPLSKPELLAIRRVWSWDITN
jgi:hypothetical protein